MRRLALLTTATLLGLIACNRTVSNVAAGELQISNAWCRASPKGETATSCYLNITNVGPGADALTGGATSSARTVEINETYSDSNILRMRPVAALALPTHKQVALAPGGYSVRLTDLKSPLVVGASVPVTLSFENAGEKQVLFPVRLEAETSR